MFTVAAIIYPGALASSITLPMEILQAASQMAAANSRSSQPQVRFLLSAPTTDAIKLASGISLKPDLSLEDLPPLDMLLLPAIWRNPQPTITAAKDWLGYLPELAARGTRICSVGTASCLLAEAGLLTGRPATTHWNYFKQFTRRYPDVELKSRHLITECDGIYCVGSVNSIADVMVHIIEEWFGGRMSRAIENQFSPEIRLSFRGAAYQSEPDSSHPDELVLEGQQWLREHLDRAVSIAELGAYLKITSRSLNRRFKTATGYSPQAWLQSQRIARAKGLLRHSNLAVSEIAWQVGLQDVSYFSRLFRRHCEMTPLRYREMVRGKLFAPETDPAD
ncbi:MAG: helix-turn-helix domain-containing protein [Proteobacteria bacterium]|nr:helix-turn-helix domain-containing protein [Pseudomonadota bacterium]